MSIVAIEIEVDEEYSDPDHDTAMTEDGYERLVDAINAVGVISSGPDKKD